LTVKLQSKAIAALAVMIMAGVWLSSGDGGGLLGDGDDDKKNVLIEAWSNQDRVVVFAQIRSTTRGVLYKHANASRPSPWDLEFTVKNDEILEITVTAAASAPYVRGGKVESKCRITVNGGIPHANGDTLRMSDASIRSTQAQCAKTV
jgi:hypothetical protein